MNKPNDMPCENCNGTGWVDSMNVDGKIICLDCDGKGEVTNG